MSTRLPLCLGDLLGVPPCLCDVAGRRGEAGEPDYNLTLAGQAYCWQEVMPQTILEWGENDPGKQRALGAVLAVTGGISSHYTVYFIAEHWSAEDGVSSEVLSSCRISFQEQLANIACQNTF